MTTTSVTVRRVFAAAGLLVVCIGIALLSIKVGEGQAPQDQVNTTGQGAETSTPIYLPDDSTIVSETDAISRSLRSLPTGFLLAGNPVARLLPYSQVDSWRGMSSPGPAATDPAWLVGVPTSGLRAIDIMSEYVPDSATPSPQLVPGAFYVWDARTGSLMGVGVLQLTGQRTIAGIQQLVNASMTIEPATPLPPYPTDTAEIPGVPTSNR